MSLVPWRGLVTSPPSSGDGGMETLASPSWKKESERKTSWKIVRLRVPGTVDHQKSSSAPDVIRICQEPRRQKKLRKKSTRVSFVIVPDSSDVGAPGKRQSSEFQTPASSSVPSIKRCSLDEIEAAKCPVERIARKKKSGTATEKERGRAQRSAELHKSPVRHSVAPRTRVRKGIKTT